MIDINDIRIAYKNSSWTVIVSLIKRIEALEAEIKQKANTRRKKVTHGTNNV